MSRWLIRTGMNASLRTLAALACWRGPGRGPAQWGIEALGRVVARARGVTPAAAAGAAALGATWQRAFPAKKQVPIVAVDATTAYGEIRTPCPLRGSGDLEACHRMMGYDRAFMARAGGRFVVLQSQAEPGVTVCKVAVRRADLPADDLVPAHLRPR
jgi:hypothetical protein